MWYRDNDIQVQNVLRLLSGLRYVPIQAIERVIDEIILLKFGEIVDRSFDDDEAEGHRALVSGMNKYLDYFLKTYVGVRDPVTKRRSQPKFSPILWNKYSFIMEGAHDLTNNVAENFNSCSKVPDS